MQYIHIYTYKYQDWLYSLTYICTVAVLPVHAIKMQYIAELLQSANKHCLYREYPICKCIIIHYYDTHVNIHTHIYIKTYFIEEYISAITRSIPIKRKGLLCPNCPPPGPPLPGFSWTTNYAHHHGTMGHGLRLEAWNLEVGAVFKFCCGKFIFKIYRAGGGSFHT